MEYEGFVLIGKNNLPTTINYSVFDENGVDIEGDGTENNLKDIYILDILSII